MQYIMQSLLTLCTNTEQHLKCYYQCHEMDNVIMDNDGVKLKSK